jgi:hypothetical protein
VFFIRETTSEPETRDIVENTDMTQKDVLGQMFLHSPTYAIDDTYHTIYLLVIKIYIPKWIIEVLNIVVPARCNSLNSVLRYISHVEDLQGTLLLLQWILSSALLYHYERMHEHCCLIIFESSMMRANKFCDSFHCSKSLLLHLVFGVTVVGIQV